MSSLSPTPPTPILARPEEHRAGWCPACHRLRPATLLSGVTDWQVEPVFTCTSCGTILRDLLTPLSLPQEAPIEAPH